MGNLREYIELNEALNCVQAEWEEIKDEYEEEDWHNIIEVMRGIMSKLKQCSRVYGRV